MWHQYYSCSLPCPDSSSELCAKRELLFLAWASSTLTDLWSPRPSLLPGEYHIALGKSKNSTPSPTQKTSPASTWDSLNASPCKWGIQSTPTSEQWSFALRKNPFHSPRFIYSLCLSWVKHIGTIEDCLRELFHGIFSKEAITLKPSEKAFLWRRATS